MEAEVRAMDEEYRECLEEIRRSISEGGFYTASDARWDARTDALAGRANALEAETPVEPPETKGR